MKRNKTLASCAKYKTPMQMNYGSPAKEGGADRLAHSRARLNEDLHKENVINSIEGDQAEIDHNKKSSLGKLFS
jgi:hypothetical protein